MPPCIQETTPILLYTVITMIIGVKQVCYLPFFLTETDPQKMMTVSNQKEKKVLPPDPQNFIID